MPMVYHSHAPRFSPARSGQYVLGCIFVYQIALWYRAERGLPLNVGMKAFLRAA